MPPESSSETSIFPFGSNSSIYASTSPVLAPIIEKLNIWPSTPSNGISWTSLESSNTEINSSSMLIGSLEIITSPSFGSEDETAGSEGVGNGSGIIAGAGCCGNVGSGIDAWGGTEEESAPVAKPTVSPWFKKKKPPPPATNKTTIPTTAKTGIGTGDLDFAEDLAGVAGVFAITWVPNPLGITLVLATVAGPSDKIFSTFSNSVINSSADWNLFSLSFANDFNNVSSNSGGNSSKKSFNGGGSLFICPFKISKSLLPLNGGSAVSIWYKTQPKEYISVLESTPSPWICSGDIYKGVPTVALALVTFDKTSAEAIPKSINFTSPLSVISTLAGLISLWVIPEEWETASAAATCFVTATALWIGSFPPLSKILSKFSVTNSVTI